LEAVQTVVDGIEQLAHFDMRSIADVIQVQPSFADFANCLRGMFEGQPFLVVTRWISGLLFHELVCLAL
jgi:hypothetical protein